MGPLPDIIEEPMSAMIRKVFNVLIKSSYYLRNFDSSQPVDLVLVRIYRLVFLVIGVS